MVPFFCSQCTAAATASVGTAARGRPGESVHESVNPGTTCWCCCRNSGERTFW